VSCFETVLGRLCLGDARELIKNVPDNSVDAIVTDPPWGVGIDRYDDGDVFYDILRELHRVLKSGGALAVYYATKKLDRLFVEAVKAGFKYYWTLIRLDLHKATRSPLGSSNYTPIIIFYKGTPPRPRIKTTDVIAAGEIDYDLFKGMSKEVFDQFKATAVSTYLVQMLADVNELVLDPFAGYGSIPYTCEVHKRRWLGFEIDRSKFEIAKVLITEKRMPEISKTRSK